VSTSDLERFREAQAESPGGYASALAELREGHKRGHWIWYVFPQLEGLGTSPEARAFGIRGLAEAMDYLRDELLGERLATITEVVASRLRGANPVALATLMGSEIDVLKLVSSMTLFAAAAERLHVEEGEPRHAVMARRAREVLAAAERQGWAACRFTRARLEGSAR
jgi:uncharacterized protein (DUF1810 family)